MVASKWHNYGVFVCFSLVESMGILKRTGRRTPGVEDVMVNLVKLPKKPSIVGCNDLQEGGRHYEG